LGRICRPPTNTVLPDMTKNATSRTMALIDGAIRQIRQVGLPDEAGLSSTAVCASGPPRPQKWVAWTVVDSRTAARHTAARQLNPFVDRYRMFTVLDATPDLDATKSPFSGSIRKNLVDSSIERDRDRTPFNGACYLCVCGPEAPFGRLAAPFASAHPSWDRTGSIRRAYRRWLPPRPDG
jgi:hypothetical protein